MNNQKILGIYDDESKLISSIQSLQDKGYKVKDVVSPYPIEKVFELLKLKTRLPALAFLYAIIGLIGTFGSSPRYSSNLLRLRTKPHDPAMGIRRSP